MQRNLQELAGAEYDLLILGGGINGVAAAREASLRGLRVALVEKYDFGWASSSQSAKIAHSGMRYLQHADFTRMRESVRERNAIVANAPHLIDSLPFLLPVYGHGIKGRETTTIYLKIFDLFSLDRQWFDDESRRIAASRTVSAEQVLAMAPGIPAKNLTGGCIWPEGQMHNTERLLMAYLRSAVELGTRAANYVAAERIEEENGRVRAVAVIDRLTGQRYRIGAKAVLNATGPWVVKTLLGSGFTPKDHGIHASKALSLLTRPLCDGYALSFPIRPMYRDKKAVVDKGSSIQFAIPWRGASLIGSLHMACDDDPSEVTIAEEEILTYLELINEGLPSAKLERGDVSHILWGIIPAEEKGSAAPLKHYKIIDHGASDDIGGLVTVVGVKYTTARDVAQKAVDVVFRSLQRKPVKSVSRATPLWGGDIERMDQFRDAAVANDGPRLGVEVVRRLVRNYGSKYVDILRYIDADPALAKTIPFSSITEAEILHAVKDEMALSLADVVLRRTDLGSLGRPADASIAACADIVARALGWDDEERRRQMADLEQAYDSAAARLRGK
jgi:glycerol-3-phosphate dehydrogenase